MCVMLFSRFFLCRIRVLAYVKPIIWGFFLFIWTFHFIYFASRALSLSLSLLCWFVFLLFAILFSLIGRYSKFSNFICQNILRFVICCRFFYFICVHLSMVTIPNVSIYFRQPNIKQLANEWASGRARTQNKHLQHQATMTLIRMICSSCVQMKIKFRFRCELFSVQNFRMNAARAMERGREEANQPFTLSCSNSILFVCLYVLLLIIVIVNFLSNLFWARMSFSLCMFYRNRTFIVQTQIVRVISTLTKIIRLFFDSRTNSQKRSEAKNVELFLFVCWQNAIEIQLHKCKQLHQIKIFISFNRSQFCTKFLQIYSPKNCPFDVRSVSESGSVKFAFIRWFVDFSVPCIRRYCVDFILNT